MKYFVVSNGNIKYKNVNIQYKNEIKDKIFKNEFIKKICTALDNVYNSNLFFVMNF